MLPGQLVTGLDVDVIAEALKPSPDVEALRARVVKLTEDFPLYDGLEGW